MSDRLTTISRPGGFLRLEIVGRYCWLTGPYLMKGNRPDMILLPNREFGEGWGGVKKIRLLQGLLDINFAQKNSELKFEGDTKGVWIIRFPVAGNSVNPEADLIIDLGLCNRQTRLGFTFSASTVFKLPNGADRPPDAAWIQRQRWEDLTPAERRNFPPIAPDFVIELRQLMLCPCCKKKGKSI